MVEPSSVETTRKNDFLDACQLTEVTADDAQDNLDLLSGEIESLEATLEPQEFTIVA